MLLGMRFIRDADPVDVTEFEYRLGPDGKAHLTIGDTNEIVSSVDLGQGDNSMISVLGEKYGVRVPPFAEGARKTYTPNDGVIFIFALLVQFSRGNGYSWAEPIVG